MTQLNPQIIQKINAIQPDPKKVFRTLSDIESFHFYRAIGEPLNEKANSYTDFLKKLQKIDALSIAFHCYRGDFERWIKETIGDPVLAAQLTVTGRSTLKGEALRNFVVQKVIARFNDFNVKTQK
jgi:hypothetical protein